MYTQDDNNRRDELVSLVSFACNAGLYRASHSEFVEFEENGRREFHFFPKTLTDEGTLNVLENRVGLGIARKQMSEADDIAAISLLKDGRWVHFQIHGMIDGFRNSYRSLIEDKMMLDERSLADLFLGEAVNYSAELDRYAEKWMQYNSMIWSKKPMKRSELE